MTKSPSSRRRLRRVRERPLESGCEEWHAGSMFEQTTTPSCMYYACMPHIQIRNVHPDVHDALVAKAAGAGQSLQQFLADKLAEIATTPTLDEVLDRIEALQTGNLSAADAVADIRRDRDSR